MAPINYVFKTMPTPDASQFTQLRKYAAIDSRPETGVKVFTHLYQPVPSVRQPVDFLPSFTGKRVSPKTFVGINYAAGHGSPLTKVFVPSGAVTSKYIQ
jgi:hypothetical protein